MAITCTPEALAAASKCYCFDKKTSEEVKIYLLAVLAGLDNLTPSQLADRAKCFCFDAKFQKMVENYLLCQIASTAGASSDCEQVLQYNVDPTVEGIVPADQSLPAVCYQVDGLDATYTWNTTTHVWQ